MSLHRDASTQGQACLPRSSTGRFFCSIPCIYLLLSFLTAATRLEPSLQTVCTYHSIRRPAMAALLAAHARGTLHDTNPEEGLERRRGRVRMSLRGGIGTPEPDPFSYNAAMMGCTALAQDGAIDSEDDLGHTKEKTSTRPHSPGKGHTKQKRHSKPARAATPRQSPQQQAATVGEIWLE
jgi:hypothetical protein